MFPLEDRAQGLEWAAVRYNSAMTEKTIATFFWDQTKEALSDLDEQFELLPDERGRFASSSGIVVIPPLILPVSAEAPDLHSYLEGLPEAPALQQVILLQAGAVSLGVFERGENLATKSIKKYVVRGKGRAQPTHLKTRGKSRYGSRLRLQNARKLLEETNQRLNEWVADFGAPDHVFYNAPVRMWPELFEAKIPPPFEKDGSTIKIPWDLAVPTTDLLLRTYRRMSFGRVLRREP